MDLFPLYITVKVSLIATAFTITIGLVLAWVMAKKAFWGKGLLDALLMQPLVIPPTVLGYYLLVAFGRGSALGALLEDGLGLHLENAARLLGKSEAAIFFGITLPLAWRGLVAGAMMAFARAVGDFGATLM